VLGTLALGDAGEARAVGGSGSGVAVVWLDSSRQCGSNGTQYGGGSGCLRLLGSVRLEWCQIGLNDARFFWGGSGFLGLIKGQGGGWQWYGCGSGVAGFVLSARFEWYQIWMW
jgi:hypothetical protein